MVAAAPIIAPDVLGPPASRAVPPPYSRPLAARPIPVAAYPPGTPRWVTYGGRRQRVIAVHEASPVRVAGGLGPLGVRRLDVELGDGRMLTLVHEEGGWYERD